MNVAADTVAPMVRGGGRPLAGLAVGCAGNDVPALVATELLEQLGATIVVPDGHPDDRRSTAIDTIDVMLETGSAAGPSGREQRGPATRPEDATGPPVGRLVGGVPDGFAGLPLHTVPYACGLATAAAAVLAVLSGADVEVDGLEIAAQVLLPAVVAAEYGTRHREPAPPRRLGGGALACDLATPDDEATFARLLDVVGRDASAGLIADEAQAWRLPVCEYVRRTGPAHDTSIDRTTNSGTGAGTGLGRRRAGDAPFTVTDRRPPLEGVTVCDLTAMWAGPLSTWLLAGAGATVHKIESSVRIDGMRGLDGGGIHPGAADPSTGTTSGMFNALNRLKSCHDLDLRVPDDRAVFFDLVRASDLVVDSFSRRVMPNLGLSPARLRTERPGIATLSMPAFPADHPWQVALGPAVHAATGLGDLGGGRFAAPVVAYPDPLAGLTAFVVASALVVGARRGTPTEHAEVTLFDATAPLALIAPNDPLVRARDRRLGPRVLDDPALEAAWELVCDGAGRHRYPRHPFRGTWAPIASTPAPGIGSALAR